MAVSLSFNSVGERALIMYLPLPIEEFYPKLLSKLVDYLLVNFRIAIIEYVPSYHSLLLEFDDNYIDEDKLKNVLQQQVNYLFELQNSNTNPETSTTLHKIPVCYDISKGFDLELIAEQTNLSLNDIINLHTKPRYLVYSIGFAPGFAYLGNVALPIQTKRHLTPRQSIPAGSVGIANNQTGIYTVTSPAGWKIVGQTPLTLYAPNHGLFSKFAIGDEVQFFAISLEEFEIMSSATIKNN